MIVPQRLEIIINRPTFVNLLTNDPLISLSYKYTHNNTISGIKNNIYISAPLSALVVANEYQYILENHDIVQGSLAEFTDSEYIDNPLIIEENTLTFFNDSKNITKIKKIVDYYF